MTTPENASVLGAKGIGTSKPGIRSKIESALLAVCWAFLAVCAKICLGMLKVIGEAVVAVVRFVIEVLAESIIELRWVLLIGLSLMALLWVSMQNDPHRPRTRPYHVDPAPGWISR